MYEWDDRKSEATRRDRGFSFEIAYGFDWDWAALNDVQIVEGEEREVHIGPIGNDLYVLVTTERGENTRVISLRYATGHEIDYWRKHV